MENAAALPTSAAQRMINLMTAMMMMCLKIDETDLPIYLLVRKFDRERRSDEDEEPGGS